MNAYTTVSKLTIIAATFALPFLISPATAKTGDKDDFGTDYGHFTQQAEFGARSHNSGVDCGRSAESDVRKEVARGAWVFSDEVKPLIGTKIPEFAPDLKWVNTKPLTMSSLRGHPVFVRFWYRGCAMCDASAPLMNELYKDYGNDGLVVIGIHHAKTTRGDTVKEVAAAAEKSGFEFPVALDNSWNTVNRFWIRGTAREYSSASLLIDQNGVIVWAHDLGRLEPNTPAAASLHAAIDKLLHPPKTASLSGLVGGSSAVRR